MWGRDGIVFVYVGQCDNHCSGCNSFVHHGYVEVEYFGFIVYYLVNFVMNFVTLPSWLA